MKKYKDPSDTASPNLREISSRNVIAFKSKTIEPWRPNMSRKRAVKASKNNRVFELSNALTNNYKAIEEGPKRKTWSKHDLRTIRPLTANQEDMFHAYINNYNICAFGSSGTGKTFLAIYLALLDVFDDRTDVEKIVIIRSTLPTREMGHLPGTIQEKVAAYEDPYHSIFKELLGKSSTYQDMKDAGIVEFRSTSFLRGTTIDKAVIIIDEANNTTLHEFDSAITRTGKDSKLMVLGDVKQNDLVNSRKETSGFPDVLRILNTMDEFAMVQFTKDDIVRGPLVKSWIIGREELGL